MEIQSYLVLNMLKEYSLDVNKLREELLQSSYFNSIEDVKSCIQILITKNWIEDKGNQYYLTTQGLDKLVNVEYTNIIEDKWQ